MHHDPHPEESPNGTDNGARPVFRPLHVGYALVRLPPRICTWEGKREARGSFDLHPMVYANPFRPSLATLLHSFIQVRIYSEKHSGLL